MPKRKLYAKDRRKMKRRRWTSVAFAVGGIGALGVVGWYLYRKIVADRAPGPGERKDWSGCLGPPDWVQPRPMFSCADKVRDNLTEEEGYITGRTWHPAGSIGEGSYWSSQWTYDMSGNDDIHDEVNLVAV